MPVVPIVANAIRAILQYLQGRRENIATQEVYNTMVRTTMSLLNMIEAITQAGGDEQQAWSNSQHGISEVGSAISELANSNEAEWRHFINKVMPDSLNWVIGYVFSSGIVPLRHYVAAIDKLQHQLLVRTLKLEIWERQTVNPAIRAWTNFQHWFNTWPLADLKVLDDWLKHPGHFAQFATGPVLNLIPSYLATQGYKVIRDQLAELMVSSWVDDPESTWTYIQEWLVSN